MEVTDMAHIPSTVEEHVDILCGVTLSSVLQNN